MLLCFFCALARGNDPPNGVREGATFCVAKLARRRAKRDEAKIPVRQKQGARRDTYHKAGRCPLAFLLIGLDARMNCSKIKI